MSTAKQYVNETVHLGAEQKLLTRCLVFVVEKTRIAVSLFEIELVD